MEPIWKDYTVTLANTALSAGVQYRISQNTQVLYQGRAFARPGKNKIDAKINDVVADHIAATWGGWSAAGGAPAVVDVTPYITEVYDDDLDTWTQKDSAVFVPDWSYDPNYDPDVDGHNFPVLLQAAPGQLIPVIVPPAAQVAVSIIKTDGTTVALDWEGEAEEFQLDWLDLANYPTAKSIVTDYGTISVDACAQYILYYLNAYGYWDWLPITGKTDEADAVTHHNREVDYNNSTPYSRAKWNYANELKRQYTFRTSYLKEGESLKMHHLLNSPQVYLHDMADGVIRPLILTGSKTEYKRGAKLYQYTITAELAQTRERR